MYDDTNWCLTCETHFEGDSPYCSIQCQSRAGPSNYPQQPYYVESEYMSSEEEDDEDEVIYHSIHDAPSTSDDDDDAGINAWRSAVAPGPPAGPPSTEDLPSLYSASASTTSLLSSASRTHRAPKLLRPTRPIPPTLCMSKPQPAPVSSSRSITTPQQQMAALTHSAEAGSLGKHSVYSGVTESSLATPASVRSIPISAPSRKPSVLGTIASQVRSWVTPSPLVPPSPLQQQQLQRKLPLVSANRRVESPRFTLIAHAHNSSAFRVASSSESSLDISEDDSEPISWWIESNVLVHSPATKGASTKPIRGSHLAVQLPADDHPSYRARGRKASRTAA
ncbi:hypothetical protein BDQ17DRAFT_1328809 [Cyathus striatus]|nr:hypothetical protein BDQ17DRAFT_1328809 [Cyathus striatus]